MSDPASDSSNVNLNVLRAMCNWKMEKTLAKAKETAQMFANENKVRITLLKGQDGNFYFGITSEIDRVLCFIAFSFTRVQTYTPSN